MSPPCLPFLRLRREVIEDRFKTIDETEDDTATVAVTHTSTLTATVQTRAVNEPVVVGYIYNTAGNAPENTSIVNARTEQVAYNYLE